MRPLAAGQNVVALPQVLSLRPLLQLIKASAGVIEGHRQWCGSSAAGAQQATPAGGSSAQKRPCACVADVVETQAFKQVGGSAPETRHRIPIPQANTISDSRLTGAGDLRSTLDAPKFWRGNVWRIMTAPNTLTHLQE